MTTKQKAAFKTAREIAISCNDWRKYRELVKLSNSFSAKLANKK